MKRIDGAILILGLLSLGGVGSSSGAAEPGTTATPASAPRLLRLDIRPQPIGDALNEFARQSGLQIALDPKDDTGITAPPVAGTLTAQEALTRLLDNSGLRYEYLNERTIRVFASAVRSEAVSRPRAGAMRLAQTGAMTSAGEASPGSGSGVAESSSSQGEGQGEDAKEQTVGESKNGEDPERSGIPEILVTGSKLGSLNTDIRRSADDIQPYVVFEHEEIARSAASNIEAFLKNQLTMNTSSSSYGQAAGTSIFGNSSSINLRGLGTGQTLILIDGRRAAGWNYAGGVMQPDLNGIPIGAVERIEVLPTTASSIYGGSATGGVINVVLRRDYSGIETRLTYENTFGSDVARRTIDLSAGIALEGGKTNVLFSGSFTDANPLFVEERDLVQRARQHIVANNPTTFFGGFAPPLGATTNIRSVSGRNLTLKSGTPLNSPITYVPAGYTGVLSDNGAALAANAGRYNLDLANTAVGDNASLLNNPTNAWLSLTIKRDLSSRLQSFLEVGGANSSSEFSTSTVSGIFTLPATVSNNPFDEAIRITTPMFGADGVVSSRNHNRRAVAGLILNAGYDWRVALDYTWNQTRFSSSTPSSGLLPAGVSAVSNGTLDVIRDTNQYHTDFSPFVNFPIVSKPVHTTFRNSTLRAAGPIPWTLPAGAPTVSTLIEYRKELYDDYLVFAPSGGTLYPSRSQTIKSGYFEAMIPLVSAVMSVPWVRVLEMQLALRRDEYTIVGANSIDLFDPPPVVRLSAKRSSTNPTVGFRYKPDEQVMLRASYATGYLPPGIDQLVPELPFVIPAEIAMILGFNDPKRGNEPLGANGDVTLTEGGSPNLRPEESESWSVGAVLTPNAVAGLRFSLDLTAIDKTDDIRSIPFNPSIFENEELVPGLIVRSAPLSEDPYDVGPVVAINAGLTNIARTEMRAIDGAIDYRIETDRFGVIDLSAGVTRMMHLRTQLTPVAPAIESAGVDGNVLNGSLKWKANSSVTWTYGNATLSLATRYFGSYWLNTAHAIFPNQGSARVESQIYHDLSMSYLINASPRPFLDLLSNTEFNIGVKNILGEKPPVDTSRGVGYSTWGDPRLTSYSLSLRKIFF